MPKPIVLFADQATIALKRGFDQMAELLALTLGPTQGNILNQQEVGGPELLSDAATIARRIIALPDRATDVGAMLMRNIAWRVHSRAGDGVAIAAVLAQAILAEALRYIQAGGNAMLLRRGIDQAVNVALAELKAQARPVIDEEDLTRVAEAITAEPALSLVLGEMFDILGATAHITVEDYVAPYLERAYYDGGRWVARLETPYLITDTVGRRAIQNDCQVVLFAGQLETLADVQPLLELLARLEKRRFLLVTYGVSGQALSTLIVNHQRDTFNSVIVSLHRPANRRAEDFADLAVITGAKVIEPEIGETLTRLSPDDLGYVRRAEATADNLVISGGRGERSTRREAIESLQAQLSRLPETDETRQEMQLRLARLSGGVGVLKIGAYSKPERRVIHQKAEKAIRSLRLAMAEGIVLGGGVAYLEAIPAVQQLAATMTGDERQGAAIVARALEEPFRRIVKNRGLTDPSVALARVHRLGRGAVYDAISDCVKPGVEAGLLDPAGVLRIALETAASGAVLAVTTEAIVLHRKPKTSMEP